MTTTELAIPVAIRWMIRKDMDYVMMIEHQSHEYPWSEKYFIKQLRERNVVAMVADFDALVVGYMVYELHKHWLDLINVAVHPDARRRTIGAQLMKRLKRKLSYQRRRVITTRVRETNLGAQLFFRDCGFRAESVERNHFEDTWEDAYVMQFTFNE